MWAGKIHPNGICLLQTQQVQPNPARKTREKGQVNAATRQKIPDPMIQIYRKILEIKLQARVPQKSHD